MVVECVDAEREEAVITLLAMENMITQVVNACVSREQAPAGQHEQLLSFLHEFFIEAEGTSLKSKLRAGIDGDLVARMLVQMEVAAEAKMEDGYLVAVRSAKP